MIRSYQNDLTRQVAEGKLPKGFPGDLVRVVRRKLTMLDNAAVLEDLSASPGNRLHALKGDRTGQHAISVNDQFRLCFRWTDAGPEDVEFVDYHD